MKNAPARWIARDTGAFLANITPYRFLVAIRIGEMKRIRMLRNCFGFDTSVPKPLPDRLKLRAFVSCVLPGLHQLPGRSATTQKSKETSAP